MKSFVPKKELILRKKRLLIMIACMAVVLGVYLILTWPKKGRPVAPVVTVEPVGVEDGEIYGN